MWSRSALRRCPPAEQQPSLLAIAKDQTGSHPVEHRMRVLPPGIPEVEHPPTRGVIVDKDGLFPVFILELSTVLV